MAEPFFQNWNEKKIKWKSFPSSQRDDNLFSKNHKPLKKTSDFFLSAWMKNETRVDLANEWMFDL